MTYPILIPSRGRHGGDGVQTIYNLPSELHPRIVLFVPHEELVEYRHRYDDIRVVTVSDYSHKISAKRQKMAAWAKENLGDPEYFWMMDDDLHFARREDPDEPRLLKMHPIEPEPYFEMFDYVEGMTKVGPEDHEFCAIGISMRQGNNNLPPEGAWNTRLIRCGLYNTQAFLDCEHDRIRFMGDFDVMLQMLEAGYDNLVVSRWTQDHKATNAVGGCETSRTAEVMNEVADELAALHPGFVKTKWKKNKTGPLAERKDVTIYWKKARQSADK